jgi:hypothetical protein
MRPRCLTFSAALLALGLLSLTGCESGVPRGTVHGEVTLDGTPVKQGTIRFEAADGSTPTTEEEITDGKYRARVPLGEMIVKISAGRVVGQPKMYDVADSPTGTESVEMIPGRYNVRSELKITVSRGEQEKSFPLTSK